MSKNILFNGSIHVPFGKSRNEILAILREGFDEQDVLYSYLVKKLSAEARFVVTYMISQTDKYNTIKVEEAADEISLTLVTDTSTKKIVCYRQPPIDILIEVLEPLVRKLVKIQQSHWQHLEYDDLKQMCYLTICELKEKGYYIHKSLINHCFNNAVLMSLRPEKGKPLIVSIYDKYQGAEGDLEKLIIGDTIIDESYELDKEESEKLDFTKWTFDEVKRILIKLLGQRQFDQLYRDYSRQHTTAQTCKMLQKVKGYLKIKGITMEDFINKYYG